MQFLYTLTLCLYLSAFASLYTGIWRADWTIFFILFGSPFAVVAAIKIKL